MSLPPQYRLTEKRAFREIFEKPCVVSDPFFRIMARLNGQDCPRLGLAVSRKVDRRAVQRNRLKRLIRESFRLQLTANPEMPAANYLVLPRAQAVTISHAEVFERLARLWNNVNRKLQSEDLSPNGTRMKAGSGN